MNKRRTHPFTSIKAIIFDVDNTLYPQTPKLFVKSEAAFCKSIRDHFGERVAELDDKHMMMIGWRSLREYGDASAIFSSIPDGDHCALYKKFHEYWPEDSIEPIANLDKQIQQLEAKGISLYVYSDAHQDWIHRALERMSLHTFFAPEQRLTRDQLACFSTKSQSSAGFQKLKEHAALDPHQMIMVDDSPKNLAKAKAMGMVTVHINHGKTPDAKGEHYDYSYPSITDFITDFQAKSAAAARTKTHKNKPYEGRG
jgi:putative hydrolase of the HAD superfamily